MILLFVIMYAIISPRKVVLSKEATIKVRYGCFLGIERFLKTLLSTMAIENSLFVRNLAFFLAAANGTL